MIRLQKGIVAVALAAVSGLALACGACIEDKVAATYDHAIVTGAAARGELVVFGEIDGPVDAQRASERIRRTAERVRGVRRGTVQASVAPPAFSFALDARVQAPEAAAAELERRVALPGLHLAVIRVLR
ncbi:MAG TPA: hypothetical protein VMN79_03990 [Casimicrobiaceae bacterium]|nr:hypothetical protein [Casimicrobiaceae bacterium]